MEMQESTRTALIVDHRGVDEEPLKEALEAGGWDVETCRGPVAADCPLLHARPCPLRNSVDAAIVHVDAHGMRSGSTMLPRLRCAADLASPGLVVLEGSLAAPRFAGTTATVGALNAPEAIVGTIEALVSERSS